jgi:hypothetical protein
MKRSVPITSATLRTFSRMDNWPYLRSNSNGRTSHESNTKRSCSGSAYRSLSNRKTETSKSSAWWEQVEWILIPE